VSQTEEVKALLFVYRSADNIIAEILKHSDCT